MSSDSNNRYQNRVHDRQKVAAAMLISLATLWCTMARADPMATASSEVIIEMTGLETVEGHLYLSAYDSKKTWLGKRTVLQHKVVIAEARQPSDGMVRFSIHLPPGDYALSLYYDADNDGKLDSNFIGIPKEPVAISNNAKASMGPPRYVDAVFSLGTESVTQRLSMTVIN